MVSCPEAKKLLKWYFSGNKCLDSWEEAKNLERVMWFLATPIFVTREIFLAEHYIFVLISRPHSFVKLDSLDDYIVQPKVHFNGVITICYVFEIWTFGMCEGTADVKAVFLYILHKSTRTNVLQSFCLLLLDQTLSKKKKWCPLDLTITGFRIGTNPIHKQNRYHICSEIWGALKDQSSSVPDFVLWDFKCLLNKI